MKEVMEAEASKGKVKVEVMVEKLNSEEFKTGLEQALKHINLKRVSPFVLNLKGHVSFSGSYTDFRTVNSEDSTVEYLEKRKKQLKEEIAFLKSELETNQKKIKALEYEIFHGKQQKQNEEQKLTRILCENISNLLEHIKAEKTQLVITDISQQNKLKQIKEIISEQIEIFLSISRDPKANLVFLSEKLLNLVIKLDSIECTEKVRMERKRAVNLAMGMLKIIDSKNKIN